LRTVNDIGLIFGIAIVFGNIATPHAWLPIRECPQMTSFKKFEIQYSISRSFNLAFKKARAITRI
jgi:hypothetical protein